jgi:hypothetical protein
VAAAVPAAVLDAADGHRELRARGHQHRHVEGAVLLGAEDLLALVEQDREIRRVGDDEVVHGGAAGRLGHRRAERRSLGERAVRQPGLGPEQREDRERAGDVGSPRRSGVAR